MSLPDREPKGLTRRDFIRGALGSLGLAAAGPFLQACASKPESPGTVIAGTAATPPEATATKPAATPTETSTPKPSAIATETQVPPTATATEVPASPTTTPTTAPTRTPTKEAEKPPLPEYGIFTGRLVDVKASKVIGSILISQLPKPVNQIFVYYVAQRGGRPFLITSLKPTNVSTVFQNAESRYERILIDASKPNQIIGGLDFSDGSRQMTFTIPLGGSGKRSLMDTYKQIQISEYGYGNAVISDEKVIKDLAAAGITLP